MVAINSSKLTASILRSSYYDFFVHMWPFVTQAPLVDNWHIKYLCDELQAVAHRVAEKRANEYDLLINVPPGSSKSSICNVMFPAWLWTWFRPAQVISASYSFDLAVYLSQQRRDIINSDEYRALFPDVRIRDDMCTKQRYGIDKGGYCFCTGTGGTVTGMHAHFLIGDDLVSPKHARSEMALREANRWYDETFSTRCVDPAVTTRVLVMQRLAEDDPAGHLCNRKGVSIRHICLPATNEYPIIPAYLEDNYVDGLLDPIRRPYEVLERERAMLGEYGYAGQFGQSPIPAGETMFDTSCVQLVDSINEATIDFSIRFWDKAGTEGGGCRTAGVRMARLNDGSFAVLDVVKGQWRADKRNKVIRDVAELDGFDVEIGIEEEPGSGGKESAEYTIKDLAGYMVRKERPTGSKEARAEPLSIQLNAKNVKIVNAEWTADFLHELQYFPVGKFKDQVDAASGAFNMLTKTRRVRAWS